MPSSSAARRDDSRALGAFRHIAFEHNRGGTTLAPEKTRAVLTILSVGPEQHLRRGFQGRRLILIEQGSGARRALEWFLDRRDEEPSETDLEEFRWFLELMIDCPSGQITLPEWERGLGDRLN